MLYAIDPNGLTVNIKDVRSDDGVIIRKGFSCPCCNEEVEVAFGPKRQYFRHKRNNPSCIAERYDNCMTEWHREWQQLFPDGTQEKYEKSSDGSYRRADVLIGNYVVEFQHSYITDEEVIARSNFYMNAGKQIIWVFDMRETWSKTNNFEKSRHTINSHELFMMKEYHAADSLPVGIRMIDTSKIILIVEVQNGDGVSLLRLFIQDKKVLAYDYGSSREKLAKAIVDGVLTSNVVVEHPQSDYKHNKQFQNITEQDKQQLLQRIRMSDTPEPRLNKYTFKSDDNNIRKAEKYFSIINESSVDMTKMIEILLSRIGCRIVNIQLLMAEGNDCRIEYKIASMYKRRDEVIDYLDTLTTNGPAPLYGAHFR